MDTLADKPAAGVIDVTLSFPAPPDSRTWRYIDKVLMMLWLCGWGWALVWPAGQVANGEATFFFVSWLSFWTVCGGFCAWALLASFRPARSESVRLEAEILRHDPGGRSWCWGRRESRDPIQVARSDIRELVLERVGERQRLWLDRGTDRREIGAALREPDREWLFAVLQRWYTPSPSLDLTRPASAILGVQRSLSGPGT